MLMLDICSVRCFSRSPNFPMSCFSGRPASTAFFSGHFHTGFYRTTFDPLAYAVSSQRNLNSHIRSYLSFCDAVSLLPLPVTVTLIIRYVAYLVSLSRAYGTSLNHLSSIKHMHKLLGHELNWDSDYRYKLLLCSVKHHLGIAVKRKTHITPRLLLDFAHLFNRENPLQAPMWALFFSGFLFLFA